MNFESMDELPLLITVEWQKLPIGLSTRSNMCRLQLRGRLSTRQWPFSKKDMGLQQHHFSSRVRQIELRSVPTTSARSRSLLVISRFRRQDFGLCEVE